MSKCPDNCKNCHEDCESNIKKLSKLQTWGILLLIAIIGCFAAFFKQNAATAKAEDVKRFTYPCMGTIVDISLFESTEAAEKAAAAIQKELKKIEDMCNIFNPESEISRLNASAADKPFVCSNELYSLLKYCYNAYEITGGAFDITAKNLMDLWGFYRKRKTIPSPAEIKNTLTRTGMNKVIFNDDAKSVFFTVKGMAFDLGGVAKGAALDNAVAAAKNAGAQKGIINLGGNIGCFREKQDGFFEIGVRDPRKRNAIIDKLQIANGFCATSGDYERFVTLNGKKYSHIMNPLTGYPVQNMCSTTVVAASGIDSDIFSTACFILGREKADRFIHMKKINDVCFCSVAEDDSFNYSHSFNHITKEVKK